MKIISGFSLVEAVVMIVVFSIIFMTFQAFFSHGVRSTMKGQDTLQAIRESSIIFSQLEKDFLASNQIDAGAAILSLDISTQDLPPIGDPQYGNMLSLGSRNATVTYSLEGASEKYILRRMIKDPDPPKDMKFAVPRMKTFEVLLVEKEHKIDPASVDPDFTQKQVFVRIVVLSKDPRFPTKEVQLTSFFVTSQMSASNWNYFYD